jgi:UDPglucose 6-dehydrogenase
LRDADALVVVTEWKQFRSPDFARLAAGLRDAVVFDGRNLYEPADVEAAGLAYYGIGRGRSIRID